MNERIKELEKQSVFFDFENDHWDFDRVKFAELLIRECINICRECIKDGYDEAEEPRGRIKQHFGVEE